MYSRNISKIYKDDAVLRIFPVPRTEIRDIELDLKMAVGNVEIDENRSENKEWIYDTMFKKYSPILVGITESILFSMDDQNLVNKLKNLSDPLTPYSTFNSMLYWAIIHRWKESLRSDIVELYNASNELDINQAIRDMIYALEIRVILTNDQSIWNGFPEPENEFKEKTIIRRLIEEVTQELEKMKAESKILLDSSTEYKVEVDISDDKLLTLPTNSLSSVKINAGVKNYIWSHVGVGEDGEPIRQLSPE